jgi:hypothetical protein
MLYFNAGDVIDIRVGMESEQKIAARIDKLL